MERDRRQNMEALARANAVRFARAQLKQGLKNGSVDIGDVLRDPPDYLDTMKVRRLLSSLHQFGDQRAVKVMRRAIPGVGPSATVGQLSEESRLRLAFALEVTMRQTRRRQAA